MRRGSAPTLDGPADEHDVIDSSVDDRPAFVSSDTHRHTGMRASHIASDLGGLGVGERWPLLFSGLHAVLSGHFPAPRTPTRGTSSDRRGALVGNPHQPTGRTNPPPRARDGVSRSHESGSRRDLRAWGARPSTGAPRRSRTLRTRVASVRQYFPRYQLSRLPQVAAAAAVSPARPSRSTTSPCPELATRTSRCPSATRPWGLRAGLSRDAEAGLTRPTSPTCTQHHADDEIRNSRRQRGTASVAPTDIQMGHGWPGRPLPVRRIRPILSSDILLFERGPQFGAMRTTLAPIAALVNHCIRRAAGHARSPTSAYLPRVVAFANDRG